MTPFRRDDCLKRQGWFASRRMDSRGIRDDCLKAGMVRFAKDGWMKNNGMGSFGTARLNFPEGSPIQLAKDGCLRLDDSLCEWDGNYWMIWVKRHGWE